MSNTKGFPLPLVLYIMTVDRKIITLQFSIHTEEIFDNCIIKRRGKEGVEIDTVSTLHLN